MRVGWCKRKLGDVISLQYGKPLPKDQRCSENGFPAYGANGVKCYAVEPYCENASIIVGRKGTAGAVNLVDGGFWPLDVTYYVTFDDEEHDLKFLYYMLSAMDLPSLATGVKPGINRNSVYAIEQHFPPLPEQRRIVAILDEAFAGIDTAIANTEKNLANARELFESYLNTLLIRQGGRWTKAKLGEEIDLKTGFAFKSKGYTTGAADIPLLRGDNIVPGKLRWEDHKKWPEKSASEYSEYLLEDGDVVLAMDRTWIKAGLKYAQISASDLPCLLVQRVARLRAGPNLDANFLKHLVGSSKFTSYVLAIQTGLGVPHISGKQISEFEFFRPTLSEQRKLSASMDELKSAVGALESINQQKLTALAELKQSLLQKAFAGELTADQTDRELESAAV